MVGTDLCNSTSTNRFLKCTFVYFALQVLDVNSNAPNLYLLGYQSGNDKPHEIYFSLQVFEAFQLLDFIHQVWYSI